jgi:hypothetical protein
MEAPILEKMQIRDWTAGTKDVKEDGSRQQPTHTSEQVQLAPPQQVKVPNRVSSRQKKIPATKSDDFFMVDSAPMIGGTTNKQISNNHHRNTNKKDSLHNLKVSHQNICGL